MRKLLIATKNKDKFREVSKILKELTFEFISLSDFSNIESVKETGKDFRENAEKKAVIYSQKTNSLTIADDSGLTVDYLNGKPGVYSSRFAGNNATYKDNNDKLLLLLKNVPFEKRQASFICYIAIADSGKLLDGCEAKCKGYITAIPKGNSGFGYDPIFVPEGYDKTFAELGEETKNKLSHRYKALIKAKEKLQNLT